MARIRSIKPEFPQSESMGRVCREARLCFVLLWTLADDSGRLRGNSRMLASLLYPYDDDAPRLIDGWLDELERERCVQRYVADGGDRYIAVSAWGKHQKIDKPTASKLPVPPEFVEPSRIVANPREASSEDQGREGIKDQGSEGSGTTPAPTRAGSACLAMKAAGIPDVSPSHPKLLALLVAGATNEELADAARHAVTNGKPSFAYSLAVAVGRRHDAAAAAPIPEGAGGRKQSAPKTFEHTNYEAEA